VNVLTAGLGIKRDLAAYAGPTSASRVNRFDHHGGSLRLVV
jgi:hypothetical protein